MASLVVTIVGRDRAGLVGQISDVVRENGGNWTESRMAHLADQFAGILLIDVRDESQNQLVTALRDLDGNQLHLVVEVAQGLQEAAAAGALWALSVVGNDRPGIVREVTQVLARRNVNVEELATACEVAPHAGGMLFRATAVLRLPGELPPDDLQQDLEAITADLMIELTESETASG